MPCKGQSVSTRQRGIARGAPSARDLLRSARLVRECAASAPRPPRAGRLTLKRFRPGRSRSRRRATTCLVDNCAGAGPTPRVWPFLLLAHPSRSCDRRSDSRPLTNCLHRCSHRFREASDSGYVASLRPVREDCLGSPAYLGPTSPGRSERRRHPSSPLAEPSASRSI